MRLVFLRSTLVVSGLCFSCVTEYSRAQELMIISDVERQPLVAATDRLIDALQFAGSPLSNEAVERLRAAQKHEDSRKSVGEMQSILDPLCLMEVNINAESRVKVKTGSVARILMQQGWRAFLIKVHNEAGINPILTVESPNSAPVYQRGFGAREQPRTDENLVNPSDLSSRWLDLSMLTREPMTPRLSGLLVEYRILLLSSRDAGKREATIAFNVGQGTQDLGFRNSTPILFDCQSAVTVKLNVKDVDGAPAMAAFTVKDRRGRVYPNPARRLAPDFFFHNQVYRQDGETLDLPAGDYQITVTRGPEYVPVKMDVTIPDVKEHALDVQLKRWIHVAEKKWYSGDHHVHAAGCAHYDSPTEGVGPDDMMRHLLGEDLNVGCVLSWGPCWYTQKNFFEGSVSTLSSPKNLMRYDVEVSGFPSSHAGHLCLLKLNEDDYPGTTRIEEWPSWTLPVLQWGKAQGGVVGYSHSGWGLALPDIMPDGSRKFAEQPWGGAPRNWNGKAVTMLPDYEMPAFDGIGANEFIVTTALDACDFISTVDTPAIWELNIWYHTLNCGMTSRISGETDFPCIYGERVGLGRIYVQLDDDEELNFDHWVDGLKAGRSYCGDGLSHILDFSVNDLGVGRKQNAESAPSRLDVSAAGMVNVTFDATALLEEQQTETTRAIRDRRLDEKPYWHIERCRINETRNVPVEIVVNGNVVATQTLTADGSLKSFNIPVNISESSWVAVRILPSVHTNPVFVHVDNQPIRTSKRSANWCIDAVKTCWKSKVNRFRPEEHAAAKDAYDRAAAIYELIASKSTKD